MFLKLSLGDFFIIKKDCETDSVHLLSLLSDKRYKNHLFTYTKVRTILRARRWGEREEEKSFLPRRILEPCISARVPTFFTLLGPDLNRANFHIIVQTRAGPRPCFRLLLIFIF